MGKKILIVDAGCTNYGKGGTLSHAFAALAKETLEGLGHTVDVTTVDGSLTRRRRLKRSPPQTR